MSDEKRSQVPGVESTTDQLQHPPRVGYYSPGITNVTFFPLKTYLRFLKENFIFMLVLEIFFFTNGIGTTPIFTSVS